MAGKFITLEGGEGAGKSTAMHFIQSYLEQAGKSVVMTREPGGTTLAEAIRQLLLQTSTAEVMDAKTELLLLFAARAQHVAQLIRPALAQNKWVVCDRFVDASYAYQQAGRGLDSRFIKLLEDFVVADLQPQLTILLDLPPTLGLERSKHRGPQDRFEQEKLEFFEKVRHAYLARAQQFPHRFHVIDASQSLEAVQEKIQSVLDSLLHE